MGDYQNLSPETEKNERKTGGRVVAALGLLVCFFLVVFVVLGAAMLEVLQTAGENLENWIEEQEVDRRIEELVSQGKDAFLVEVPMDDYLAEKLRKIEETKVMTEGLGTAYDNAWPLTKQSNACIVKKDGKWGMVSVTGEVLVPLIYERYSYSDSTGWVEFEKEGRFYVFDGRGNQVTVYDDKLGFRMKSEEAYLYRTATAYMSGMKITTTVPEMLEDDFYGVRYCSKKTGQELYRVEGGYEDVGIYTLPDETGRAVAIRGDGWTNTIYYITENGCESRVMELPEGINGRWFDFLGDYTWADISLSNGWLKVYVCDAVPGLLRNKYEYYTAFLNVDTLELVPFPEEYQDAFTIYDIGYGDAMAIRLYNEEDEYYRYAICKGSKKLTEEIYYWVEFGENYMTAGHDDGVDILNYDGEVLGTYWDVSGNFVNGKMLVYDETGVVFIDENLEICSDYIVKGIVDGCFSRGVIIDDKYYLLEEFAQ